MFCTRREARSQSRVHETCRTLRTLIMRVVRMSRPAKRGQNDAVLACNLRFTLLDAVEVEHVVKRNLVVADETVLGRQARSSPVLPRVDPACRRRACRAQPALDGRSGQRGTLSGSIRLRLLARLLRRGTGSEELGRIALMEAASCFNRLRVRSRWELFQRRSEGSEGLVIGGASRRRDSGGEDMPRGRDRALCSW